MIPWLLVSSGFPILARAARDDTGRLRYGLQKLFEVSALLGGCRRCAWRSGRSSRSTSWRGRSSRTRCRCCAAGARAGHRPSSSRPWSFALLSLKRYAALLIPNLAAAITAAVGTLVLVPPWGAEGAALATCGAEAVLAVGYLIALWRVDRTLVPSFAVLPAAAAGDRGGGRDRGLGARRTR